MRSSGLTRVAAQPYWQAETKTGWYSSVLQHASCASW